MVLLDEFGNQSGPAGLMTRADPGAVVAVEVFVEQDQITPVWVGLEFFVPPNTGLLPACPEQPSKGPAEKSCISRRDISPATSQSVIIFPEPVGNSTLKSSPR